MSVIEGPWKGAGRAQAAPKPWKPPAITVLAGGLSDAFALQDRSHICPTLDSEFATQLEFCAALARQLAERAKQLKRMHEEITLSNVCEILEHRAAMIRVELLKDD